MLRLCCCLWCHNNNNHPTSAATPTPQPSSGPSSQPSNDFITHMISSVPRSMSYQELFIATNNFSELLGKGGYGTVFKGTLFDDQGRHIFVAVKRFTSPEVDLKSFEHEVTILAKVSHKNLVKLRGWCTDQQEYMVVYELLPNGSLDKSLFGGGEVLSWERRFSVLLGVGSALSYLHDSASGHAILHRDLKPSNILLDGEYEAKLGDFGLSRELEYGRTERSTVPAGTRGYMSPEMLSSGKATKMSDMYSYGVVLATVACGKKAVEREASPNLLIDRLWQCHGGNRLLDMAEQRLWPLDESQKQQLTRVLVIALACCHPDPAERPPISTALEMLKGNAGLPVVPPTKPRPNYYTILPATISETEANSSSASGTYCSATLCPATVGSQTLTGR